MIEGVDVTIFKPLSVENARLIPGLVYFHGGGWVFGSPGNVQILENLTPKVKPVIFLECCTNKQQKFHISLCKVSALCPANN